MSGWMWRKAAASVSESEGLAADTPDAGAASGASGLKIPMTTFDLVPVAWSRMVTWEPVWEGFVQEQRVAGEEKADRNGVIVGPCGPRFAFGTRHGPIPADFGNESTSDSAPTVALMASRHFTKVAAASTVGNLPTRTKRRTPLCIRTLKASGE